MLFKKSQRGWRLMRQGLAILQENKSLIILSLIGRGFFFLMITAMMVMAWLIRSGKIDYNSLTSSEVWAGYGVLVLALWIGNIMTGYFNAALTACLLQYVNGQSVNLKQSLRIAWRRFWIIFLSIFAHFTLGFVVMIFHGQFNESGRINRLLSGLNWRFATLLMAPLIINEPMDFLPTLQRSSQLMYDFAGKNPQFNFSCSYLSLFLRALCTLPMIVGLHIDTPLGITAGLVATFFLLLGVAVLFNATFVVISQALYQQIAHHKTIAHFCTQDLTAAIIRPRK